MSGTDMVQLAPLFFEKAASSSNLLLPLLELDRHGAAGIFQAKVACSSLYRTRGPRRWTADRIGSPGDAFQQDRGTLCRALLTPEHMRKRDMLRLHLASELPCKCDQLPAVTILTSTKLQKGSFFDEIFAVNSVKNDRICHTFPSWNSCARMRTRKSLKRNRA
jgi:hypothetical protein